MKKSRRNILLSSLALASSTAFLGACKGGTPDKPSKSASLNKKLVKWKMATSFPKNFPGADLFAQKMAKDVEIISEGQLKIEHFGANELVPAFEVFDAVRNGSINCGVSAPYYWISKHKALPFFCTVPGGMTAMEKFAWLKYGGGQLLWDEVYSAFNLKGILFGNTGVQMGGWFKKEIKSVEDFKGLKMRIPGIGAEIINRMGGTAVNMPGGEIMPSLQQGVIDAAEWVAPWVDILSGFHKVAKFYYGPGIHEPGTSNELLINKESWEELPESLKKIIINTSHACYVESLAEALYYNSETYINLEKKYKIKLKNFPSEVTKEMIKISNEVVRSFADLGDVHRRIYESWKKSLDQFNKYQSFAEYGYIKERINLI